jgi:hypothetical protein
MLVVLTTSLALSAAPDALARSRAERAVLCSVLPTGRAFTVAVPNRLAWPLTRLGAWDGACGLRRAATIQGRVTDMLGHPTAGVCVQVFVDGPDGNELAASHGVSTSKTGNYHVWIPFAGNAHVLFAHAPDISQYDPDPGATLDGCNSPFVFEWYDNAPYGPEAFQLSIPVSEGTRVTGVDAVLARRGTISGKLTDDATGTPIAGALVTVAENSEFCTYTADDGTYSLPLGPGSYRVDFNPAFAFGCFDEKPVPPYVEEWYRDEPDQASANVVVVGDGKTVSGIDGALRRN